MRGRKASLLSDPWGAGETFAGFANDPAPTLAVRARRATFPTAAVQTDTFLDARLAALPCPARGQQRARLSENVR